MPSFLLSDLLLTSFPLISANETRRCTSCYTWYIDLPTPSPKPTCAFLRLNKTLLLKYCSTRSTRPKCPQCRREKIEKALALEKEILTAHLHLLTETETRPDHQEAQGKKTPQPTPPHETRRHRARRDVKLYHALRAQGSHLPPLPPKQRSRNGVDGLLTWAQDRALFRALQELGAFRYPGMAENFRDEHGGRLSDEEIYEIVRQRGCRWDVMRGWVQGGRRVSFEKRNVGVVGGGVVRRWERRGRVSGRKMPKRMDRGDFRLEAIVEVDEVEIDSPLTSSHAREPVLSSGVAGQHTQGVKNFSRRFDIERRDTGPHRAIVGYADVALQLQHIPLARHVGKASEDPRGRKLGLGEKAEKLPRAGLFTRLAGKSSR